MAIVMKERIQTVAFVGLPERVCLYRVCIEQKREGKATICF